MSNEITVSGSLRWDRPSAADGQRWAYSNKQITQTGTNVASGVINVGTSAETIAMTDVGTAGWALFLNHDSTNYVEIGKDVSASFEAFAKMKAGEYAGPFRLADIAPQLQANTAACDVQYWILED